jgi:hypothetical protein
MAAPREAIFAALFERLQTGVADIQTFSRLLLGFDEAAAADQPALYLVKGSEESITTKGMPLGWRLRADIVVFCRNDADPTAAPSIQLNAILTDIETALERKPGEVATSSLFPNTPGSSNFGTTLGGLCSHCWIAGGIEVGEGTIGSQAIAIVPVEILTSA